MLSSEDLLFLDIATASLTVLARALLSLLCLLSISSPFVGIYRIFSSLGPLFQSSCDMISRCIFWWLREKAVAQERSYP
ncbi:hypothetical protein B0H13DRAFT_1044127 [Mycena leptocephala]|nr:hypothetical protein B0H13DRAFT_1044127 [Mycena leptocephala]